MKGGSSPKRHSVRPSSPKGNPLPARARSPSTPSLPDVRGTKLGLGKGATVQCRAVAAPAQPASGKPESGEAPVYAKPDKAIAATFLKPKAEELKEIEMYGELTQITYDSFRNKEQAAQVLAAPRFGDSGFEQRYKDSSMGQLVELLPSGSLARKRGYKIIDFLYANSGWYFNDIERAIQNGVGDILQRDGNDRSPDNKSVGRWLQEQYNWIGYVAVSDAGADGKQDLVVAFRGTITSTEWVADLDATLIKAEPWAEGTEVEGGKNAADTAPVDPNKANMPNPKAARICRGFKKMYAKPSSADPVDRRPPQAQIHQDMDFIFNRKKEDFKIGSITCIGHSLGAALATLAAYDLAHASCVPNDVKIRVCNFCGPKAGDDDFVANFKSLGIDVHRVVNVWDVVTSVPGLSAIALKQIAEATKKAAKKAVGLENSADPEHVHRSVSELLKGAGRWAGIEVAEFVQTIAAWKHNPFMGPLLGSFFHVADPIALDTSSERLAKLIKQPADFSGCHNLEMVLHMLNPNRDPCLINKGGDILLDSNEKCKNWWVESQNIVPPTCPAACHEKK